MAARIIIIANRGPNDFVWQEGTWVTRPAAGGLVSMLEPLARRPDVAWFCCVSEPPDAEQARQGLFTTAGEQTDQNLHVVPVPLPAEMYHAYYGQISNEVLWMLQHHMIGPGGYESLDEERHRAWTAGYLAANERLAEAVAAANLDAAAFLIQDYHLYPLPALLRQTYPKTPILHFTHIPFPEASTWRLLPRAWRTAILHGLLGADWVGLQTGRDVRSFLGCCEDLGELKVDRRTATVTLADGRPVRVRAFPASADPAALERTMKSAPVAAARTRLAGDLGDRCIIRVDRLDPSKNQLAGFQAFARLLELRPDLRGQVRFLAFLVPSRTDLSVYRAYSEAIYRTIGEINERFGAECGEPPIKVFYTNDREQALAAMETCSVLLVNSLADGMNLVAKEWAIVARRAGTLVVSETAGVADDVADCALLVSPLDIEGTAQTLAEALDLSAAERQNRLARLRERVVAWTADDWLSAQLDALGVELPPLTE